MVTTRRPHHLARRAAGSTWWRTCRRLARQGTLRTIGVAAPLPLLLAESPLDRLKPEQRAKLIGSLVLLTIGGVALIVLAWLALRVGRRSSQREDLAMELFKQRVKAEDWASKPLVPPERGPVGEQRPDDSDH